MSYSITVSLRCDECSYSEKFSHSTERAERRSARRRAKSKGWVHQDGRDICPQCIEDMEFSLSEDE